MELHLGGGPHAARMRSHAAYAASPVDRFEARVVWVVCVGWQQEVALLGHSQTALSVQRAVQVTGVTVPAFPAVHPGPML